MTLRTLALAVTFALVPIAADAGPKLCGERGAILNKLETAHDEVPQAIGLTRDGGVLEVVASPTGGWTMIVTYPGRPTCIIAVGEAWETLQFVAGDPA